MHATVFVGLRDLKLTPEDHKWNSLKKEYSNHRTDSACLSFSSFEQVDAVVLDAGYLPALLNNCRGCFLGINTRITKPTDQRKSLNGLTTKPQIQFLQTENPLLSMLHSISMFAAWNDLNICFLKNSRSAVRIWTQYTQVDSKCVLSKHKAES